jgi:integrase
VKGHVRKRGNKYSFVIDIGRKPDGSRNRKWFSGYDTKKEAETECAKKITELTQGKYVEPTKKTVSQFMDEWLEYKLNNKRKPIRPSTHATYKMLIENHVKPHIGRNRIDKTHETTIEELYEYLQDEKELSPSTIHKIHADILKPAFRRAVKYRFLHHNPADIEDPPQPNKPVIKIWNQEEMQSFLDIAINEDQYYIFHLGLNTGMRIGEMLGLKREFVDLSSNKISILHSLHAKDRTLGPTKTLSSVRNIEIDELTVKVLEQREATIQKQKELPGDIYNDNDFICCTKTGIPLLQSNVRRKFNSLIIKAGVPKIRIHDMRHTFATLQLLAGTDIKTVSSILGHSSVWFTYDTYSHVLPEMQKAAADNQANIMKKKS